MTIKDIAKHAGVSISTVSLVLNNSPMVKHSTRKKVTDIIEEYNFKPNQNARSLITKTKKIIGVVRMTDESEPSPHSFGSTIDTYLSEMLWNIEAGINSRGYSMLLDWHNISDPKRKLPALIDVNKVDGIICVGGLITDDFIESLKKSDIPVVLVGSRSSKVDFIDIDVEKAIFLAADYLIQQGNQRIAFINNTEVSQSMVRKLAGFKKAVHGRDIKTWTAKCSFNGQAAYDVFNTIWESSSEKPSAVVCAADCMAVGVIRCMNDHGLKCPEDISVTGYEDGLLAEYCVPALTTVCINKPRLGAEACEILFNRFRNPRAHQVSRIIEPELVIRNSTGYKE
ncbi:LacI family transcriptional regulator [Treponema sp. OttesenSCG-928-L16]|nr:LacI family transcriptional regulator [Treponema sp. OttesenSCG-928-L16]